MDITKRKGFALAEVHVQGWLRVYLCDRSSTPTVPGGACRRETPNGKQGQGSGWMESEQEFCPRFELLVLTLADLTSRLTSTKIQNHYA